MQHPLYSKKLLKYFNSVSEVQHPKLHGTSKPIVRGSSQCYDGEQIIISILLTEDDMVENAFCRASGGVPIIGIASWSVDFIKGKQLHQLDKSLTSICIEQLELSPAQWYGAEILMEAIDDLKTNRNFL